MSYQIIILFAYINLIKPYINFVQKNSGKMLYLEIINESTKMLCLELEIKKIQLELQLKK